MKKIITKSMLVLSSVILSVSVQAASIGLSPLFPDQTTFNAPTTYVYDEGDCLNSLGTGPASGACGDSKLSGNPSSQYNYNGEHVDGTGGGTLTVTDGAMAINIDGLGLAPINGGDYALTADFDYDGNITGASISVLGTVDLGFNPAGDFQSGVIAASTSLLEFGFAGVNDTGVFEFVFDAATGDLPAFSGATTVSVIVGATSLAGLSGYGSWDPLNVGDTAFFQQNFVGSTSTVDTYVVPVPGALILFMSSMSVLLGSRVRRKATR